MIELKIGKLQFIHNSYNRAQLRSFLTKLRKVFTPIAFAFILFVVWSSADNLLGIYRQVDAAKLFVVILILMFAHVFIALNTLFLFLMSGQSNIRYRVLFNIHVDRLPARYIPGGIWQTVARTLDFKDKHIEKEKIFIVLFCEIAISLMLAFTLSGIFFWTPAAPDSFWSPIAQLFSVGSLLGVLLLPFLIGKLIEYGIANVVWYFLALLSYAVVWGLYGFGFLLYFESLSLIEGSLEPIAIISSYLFSWGIGFLSIFAPQGIGVFELVSASLIPVNYGMATAVSIIVGFRFISMAADLILWAGVTLITRAFGRHE